ncbi:TonB-dependent receptor domain-containing protein [Aliikangiella sp. IMCC44359]|uniref:TonB-dependent receptor domain-containing protein n=1 Tax=Aliikangiella sp. IMCC44359 TaxID=3459125 RepID=UPI00403B1888
MRSIFNKRALVSAVSLALLMPGIALSATQDEETSPKNPLPKTEQLTQKTDSQEKNKDDKIVITGSRIKRDSYTTSAPIATMGLDAIQDTGSSSLQDILVENFPSISEASSNTNTQSSITHTGLSTVQLRNLGSDRTLILIDGRRVVSNSKNGNIISLSTIASGMVDRIETLSGGASAVYGSDAVSGVINIITQKDKEGFEIKAKGGYRPEGGGERHSLEFNFGSSFDNGKGYTYFSAEADRNFGVSFYDHDRAQIEASHDYDNELMCNRMLTKTDGRQCMRDITLADWGSRDDGTAGGVFEESSNLNRIQNGGFWYDENNVLRTGWREERDGVNTRQWVWVRTPIDRSNLAFKLDYDFGNNLSSYFQVQYNQNESINTKSPENDNESGSVTLFDPATGDPLPNVRPGTISIDNPFAPALIADNAGSSISWDRRFYEVGQVTTDNQRSTIRTWAGLQGFAFDNTWEWDLSVGFGRFNQDLTRLNEIDVRKQAQALDSERLADGTIQCRDAAARAAGCVPLNIFGIGSVTPEMADWIRVNPTVDVEVEMTNVLGYLSGELFDMPAGAVAGSFGFEYRKDTTVVNASDGARFGGITYNIVPNLDGEITIKEAFGEIAVPLLRNAPAAKSLDLDLSLRLADYNSNKIDLVKSYRAGINWEFIDGYGIRANLSRSQRAPNIDELDGVPTGDYDGFSDICDGVTLTSTLPGHDACRQEPTIAAVIADGSTFEDDNNGYSPNTGNPDLIEETADTLTVGFVSNPFDNFDIAIDYYDIEISDAIGLISNEDIIRGCYNSSEPFGPNNSLCQDISRNEEGQINQVLQRQQNLENLRSRGVDVAMQYRFNLQDMGNLSFKLDYSHASEVSTTFDTPDGLKTVREDGFLSIPKDRASASVVYRWDNWRIRWRTEWLGKMTDSQQYEEDYLSYVADNDARCASADQAGCITNPEVPINLYYPSYVRHDLSVSYNMDISQDQELRIYGGMNNIFDNQGKFAPGFTGNSVSTYGRGTKQYVYLGVDYSFR